MGHADLSPLNGVSLVLSEYRIIGISVDPSGRASWKTPIKHPEIRTGRTNLPELTTTSRRSTFHYNVESLVVPHWRSSLVQTAQIPLNWVPWAVLGSLPLGCDRAIHVSAWNYSDSKNWFTFGKIFLVRPIVAQGTMLNPWEFLVTKQGIISIFVPNIRSLCLSIDLIQHLQWPRVNEPVFVLALHISSFGHYHCSYPSGHALN